MEIAMMILPASKRKIFTFSRMCRKTVEKRGKRYSGHFITEETAFLRTQHVLKTKAAKERDTKPSR